MIAAITRTIRPLRATDVPYWQTLQAAALPDPYTHDALQRELENPLARHHGIFERGGLVATFLAWLVVDELQVMQVVVADRAMGRRLGSDLVQHALLRAKAAGAMTATLEVRGSNVAAIALYRGCGFVVDGERRGYYPDGEDAVLMRCALHEVDPRVASNGATG